jgi:hypothetical protein
MTISASYAPNLNVGNGVTRTFTVDFPFGAAGDLVVTLFDTVAETDVSPAPVMGGGGTYDYTVGGTPDPDTGIYANGSVTFTTAPLATHIAVRARATPQVQETVLTDNGRFPAKSVEGSFDRQEMQLQERAEDLGRAIKVRVVDGPGTDTTLPALTGNANKALIVNPTENGFVLGSIEGDIEQAGIYAAAAAASAVIAQGVAGPTPEMYGAKGDAVISDAGAITSASHDFSDASRLFTVADVGKTIGIMGAGAAGVTLITTIASLAATHHVNLTAAAATTVSSAHYAYGTDDGAALAAFFAANVGKAGAFETGSAYLSTRALSAQMSYLDCRARPVVFLIGNNTDDCLALVPPVKLITTQTGSRFVYNGLNLDAMATGLDLLYLDDGSPALRDMILINSYRDTLVLNPHYSPNTAIENLMGWNWYMGNCGRHAAHLWLLAGMSTTIQVYINETNIHGWEIRGIGVRFGSGTGASRANAIRITYDGVDVALLSANKVSAFRVYGYNWDCAMQSSLGAAAPGDVIYHNCINGTTGRQVELFRLMGGGIESTGGVVPPNTPLIINGNALAAGDWIECYVEAIYYQWAFALSSTLLADPADQNTFWNTTGTLGAGGHAMTYLPFQKRPTDGRALVSTDVAPNGGMIDPNFKNAMTPWLGKLTMVASANATVDIPIDPLPVAGIGVQWPMKVIVSVNPYGDSVSYWAYGEYTVLMVYEVTGNTTHIASIVGTTKVPGDVTLSFTPATDVTFSIVSSSGTLRDRLRVTIAGGASVGAAGALKQVQIMASRWGMGLSQQQRVDKIGEPSQEYSCTV